MGDASRKNDNQIRWFWAILGAIGIGMIVILCRRNNIPLMDGVLAFLASCMTILAMIMIYPWNLKKEDK